MIIALKKTGVKQTESHRRNRSEAVKKWWAKRKNKTHGIL
jgi:hypothetical protein